MIVKDLKEISKHLKIDKEYNEKKVRSNSRSIIPESGDT